MLRNTGGGGMDVGTASVTIAELRSSCLKEDFCDWSRPGTSEWVSALQAIDLSFAHKERAGANIGIIELAMVVGASRFIHTVLAPPPPAASFVNFTVESRIHTHFLLLLLLTQFCLKFGPIALIKREQTMNVMQAAESSEGSVYTLLTYAVRVDDTALIKLLLKHGDGITQIVSSSPFFLPPISKTGITFVTNCLPISSPLCSH